MRYLVPGEIDASEEPRTIVAVVGSSVAVCLYDPSTSRGGMSHLVLPADAGVDGAEELGAAVILKLIGALVELGCRREGLVAKVLGGACVRGTTASRGRHLGARNVVMALATLKAEAVPVVAEDVNGVRARKVVFHTDSGATWVRRL